VPNRRTGGEPVAYAVRVTMVTPRETLVVTRQPKPSFREALSDAFNAARRRLQDHARELRGDVKAHAPKDQGWVSQLLTYEGYGFITTPEGRQIYFHRNSVLEPGFDRLTEGMEVRFVEEAGETGPQASTVAAAGA
jgi:cold shock CspA family protein